MNESRRDEPLNDCSRTPSPNLHPSAALAMARRAGLESTANAIVGILLLAAMINAVRVFAVGWGNTILDHHGFRQAQTAVSTYYILQGGPLVAYETPVLGYPWSIPFEFPLYQWLVAGLVHLTGMPIEQGGRVVSVTLFLFSLAPAWIVLRRLRLKPASCLACLTMLLASPIYLFWSRAFMIESTALCLSFCYLAAVATWRARPSAPALVAGTVFGTVAALVKVTTFLGFAEAAGILLMGGLYSARPWRQPRVLLVYALAAVLFALVPYLALDRWVAFSDGLKHQNYFATGFITSKALDYWTYGNLAMRKSKDTWLALWQRHPLWVGHWIVLAIGAAALPFAQGRRFMALALLALAIGSVLVFTNLHLIHDYYQYGNIVFLLGAIGTALGGLVESGGWRRVAGLLMLAVATATMIHEYGGGYLHFQVYDNRGLYDLGEHVRAITRPDDVVLVWGMDWSPELSWAAKRRALMDYADRDPMSETMVQALEALRAHSYQVKALVFCGRERDEAFVDKRLAVFPGFRRVYESPNSCDLYGTD